MLIQGIKFYRNMDQVSLWCVELTQATVGESHSLHGQVTSDFPCFLLPTSINSVYMSEVPYQYQHSSKCELNTESACESVIVFHPVGEKSARCSERNQRCVLSSIQS